MTRFVAVLAYTAGVLFGPFDEAHRIDAVHLGLIALAVGGAAVLVRPDLFPLKRLEVSGFKLELLERVRAEQIKQENVLHDLEMMLPLLPPQAEREHLLNLDRGRSAGYWGGGPLWAELRRLRSIGLLELIRLDRQVGQLRGDRDFDLAEFVRLTPLGHRWVRKFREIGEEGAAPRSGGGERADAAG
ncbi:hypothetical protein [Alienimonas californiensis]|uniref:Uncharacterized protein n=1 Tax=Alienimonas californiensis TaxID=2527989 RepID=A0A517PBI7_9PLAN|nr:hypothetical protein [Alienimonas californiensis]QDT16748.1 hypothetical protein CA12_28550 [Alienimonas californiensis]